MIFESVDVEHWLLAGLLRNNIAILEIPTTPEDFYYPQHGSIFSLMKTKLSESGGFSYVDLMVWANGQTFYAPHDGVEYVRSIADQALGVDIETIKGYAGMLSELSRKRKIYAAIKDAEAMIATQSTADVLAFMQDKISGNTQAEFLKTNRMVHDEIIENFRLPPKFHSTGLPSLDAAMGGGMYSGFTYGLCGAEKAGKTTLAHTISHNLACPHLYVAMEMGAKQIEQRNIARELGINSLAFLKRTQDVETRTKTVKFNENIIWYDAPGASLDEIIQAIALAQMKYKIEGFIIDYWQLVGGQAKGELEEKHLRRVAQALADHARKKGLWCILLAQMNKEGQLFGGNGLRKACDQLYMIEQSTSENGRWLRMDASRYTLKCDIGAETNPALVLDIQRGPHFRDRG